MDTFIGFSDRIFYKDSTQQGQITRLEVNQDDEIPLNVAFLASGAIKDMTGWICEAAIVGDPGAPRGTPPYTPLAAFSEALVYNASTGTFQGSLQCNTTPMANLIGGNAFADTYLAVKITLPNANPALVQQFTAMMNCRCWAAPLRDDASGIPGILAVYSGTVPEGQSSADIAVTAVPAGTPYAFAIQTSPGPGVSFCSVNALDLTVTVTLAGPAPSGGTTVQIFLGSK